MDPNLFTSRPTPIVPLYTSYIPELGITRKEYICKNKSGFFKRFVTFVEWPG